MKHEDECSEMRFSYPRILSTRRQISFYLVRKSEQSFFGRDSVLREIGRAAERSPIGKNQLKRCSPVRAECFLQFEAGRIQTYCADPSPSVGHAALSRKA